MPLGIMPVLLLLAILVTFASLIYLMINARAVARLFRKTEMVPGPGRRIASRGAVTAALVAFNLGWVATIAVYWAGWSGEANQLIETTKKYELD